MEDSVTSLSAFVQYQNREDDKTLYALELTQAMINMLAEEPELEDLAKAARPGDFIIGFENRVMPGEEFREKYRLLT